MTDGSAVVLLLRMAVSLAVVLGLIVWAARALNRRQGGLLGRPQRQVLVAVLGRQSLSRHAGLTVVQVGEEILVLGVTDAEVSLLTTIDPATLPDPDPDVDPALQDEERTGFGASAAAEAAPYQQPVRPDAPSFADALRQAAGLTVRRDVKRQAAGARSIVGRVAGGATDDGSFGQSGGRHRG